MDFLKKFNIHFQLILTIKYICLRSMYINLYIAHSFIFGHFLFDTIFTVQIYQKKMKQVSIFYAIYTGNK